MDPGMVTAGADGSAVMALCYTSRDVKVTELGHVSLFVRDLEGSIRFYRDLLGLVETGRGKAGRIAFLSAGAHHHDVSLEVARAEATSAVKGAPGLYHIAFCVGRTLEELDAARRDVERHGLMPFGEGGGGTPCFCVKDPDGNEIELYVETSDRC
jgi:catechol 2,3-dioxygenase